MTSDVFKQGMMELYQGEVFGEALFDQMLSYFDDPDKQYKVSIMLQLETETKARLRPAMMRLGLDLGAQQESRQMGLDMAAALKGLSWKDTMTQISDAVKPAVERYKEIAASAPSEYQQLAESMVAHERSLYDFAELELSGNSEKSSAVIEVQLHNKLR